MCGNPVQLATLQDLQLKDGNNLVQYNNSSNHRDFTAGMFYALAHHCISFIKIKRQCKFTKLFKFKSEHISTKFLIVNRMCHGRTFGGHFHSSQVNRCTNISSPH